MTESNLHQAAWTALRCADPAEKCTAVDRLRDAWNGGQLDRSISNEPPVLLDPGRPAQPELVAAREVPRRKLTSPAGKIAFVHAIAHIEFNAINLALDAVYRFRDMPDDYYSDWLRVAADEARHFQLLNERLIALGSHYGALPAHNGLWEMAVKTAGDVLERMALVPRVLEARGLDVTPGMIQRLSKLGDHETVGILQTILAEEVPHVAIGSRWYRWCCEQRGIEPESHFISLLKHHGVRLSAGEINRQAREAAGFSLLELDEIARIADRQAQTAATA